MASPSAGASPSAPQMGVAFGSIGGRKSGADEGHARSTASRRSAVAGDANAEAFAPGERRPRQVGAAEGGWRALGWRRAGVRPNRRGGRAPGAVGAAASGRERGRVEWVGVGVKVVGE